MTAPNSAVVDPAPGAPAAHPRRITGLVMPYGQPGYTSAGKITVNVGVLQLPQDTRWIKLYKDHSNQATSVPVGRAISSLESAEGLAMTFEIADTEDGRKAIADIDSGVRDALSVEILEPVVRDGQLISGILSAVALVPTPAFQQARITNLSAALHYITPLQTDRNINMNTTAPITAAVDTNVPRETSAPAPITAAPATAPITTAPITAAVEAVTLDTVVSALHTIRTGAPRTDLITAALADITDAAHPSVQSPQWLGELWSGIAYTREIVPTMTHKTLTGRKATGWRWSTKPAVAEYSGNKAEIPTNTPVTSPVEITAQRIAGGHDIDRAYFDFNDQEFIRSYFAAMADSYAMLTDDKAAEFLVSESATNKGAKQATLLRAAAKARQMIKTTARIEATTYLVNPNDLFDLLAISQLDAPAYLKLIGVDPAQFVSSTAVAAGTVVAYAKPAVEFYELGSSPIRVEAEHISHGGRDAALFGYWAALVTNSSGLVQVPFGATP